MRTRRFRRRRERRSSRNTVTNSGRARVPIRTRARRLRRDRHRASPAATTTSIRSQSRDAEASATASPSSRPPGMSRSTRTSRSRGRRGARAATASSSNVVTGSGRADLALVGGIRATQLLLGEHCPHDSAAGPPDCTLLGGFGAGGRKRGRRRRATRPRHGRGDAAPSRSAVLSNDARTSSAAEHAGGLGSDATRDLREIPLVEPARSHRQVDA